MQQNTRFPGELSLKMNKWNQVLRIVACVILLPFFASMSLPPYNDKMQAFVMIILGGTLALLAVRDTVHYFNRQPIFVFNGHGLRYKTRSCAWYEITSYRIDKEILDEGTGTVVFSILLFLKQDQPPVSLIFTGLGVDEKKMKEYLDHYAGGNLNEAGLQQHLSL